MASVASRVRIRLSPSMNGPTVHISWWCSSRKKVVWYIGNNIGGLSRAVSREWDVG